MVPYKLHKIPMGITDDFFETLWMFIYAATLDNKPALVAKYQDTYNKTLAEFTPEQQAIINERLTDIEATTMEKLQRDDYLRLGNMPEEALREIYISSKNKGDKAA